MKPFNFKFANNAHAMLLRMLVIGSLIVKV